MNCDSNCGNCRFSVYAHSMRGKNEPYCNRHRKWIGDMILCSDWEPNNFKPITNADRLRSMSDEELAVILAKITEPNKLPMFHGLFMNGEKDVWLDWLRQEAQDV